MLPTHEVGRNIWPCFVFPLHLFRALAVCCMLNNSTVHDPSFFICQTLCATEIEDHTYRINPRGLYAKVNAEAN